MKYNELQIGRQKKPKRVGRGISAGGGKTAVDADAEPRRIGFEAAGGGLALRIEVVGFCRDDDRIGSAVDAGGHAVAFIGRKQAAPRLLRGLRGG